MLFSSIMCYTILCDLLLYNWRCIHCVPTNITTNTWIMWYTTIFQWVRHHQAIGIFQFHYNLMRPSLYMQSIYHWMIIFNTLSPCDKTSLFPISIEGIFFSSCSNFWTLWLTFGQRASEWNLYVSLIPVEWF